MFINNVCKIPTAHYRFLWKNLKLQTHYNQEGWIISYWETASQRYRMAKHTTLYDNNKEVDTWSFLEFHIVLVAMLIEEKKYDLVKQLLSLTNSIPEEYPLVPSTVSEIFQALNTIHDTTNKPGNFAYYESKYPMPKMHGISEGRILGAINLYLALLMYRVFTLPHNYGEEHALSIRINFQKTNLHELRIWKESVQKMDEWLKIVDDDPKLKEILEFRTHHKLDDSKNHVKIKEIIDEILRIIEETADKIRQEQNYNDQIVNSLKEEIVKSIVILQQPSIYRKTRQKNGKIHWRIQRKN